MWGNVPTWTASGRPFYYSLCDLLGQSWSQDLSISKGILRWAGGIKAKPRVSHLNMRRQGLFTGQHRCTDTSPQNKAWGVISQTGAGQDPETKEKEKSVHRDRKMKWERRLLIRLDMGHRLSHKGQWSSLIQYWSREGIVSIPMVENPPPKMRRWRGRVQIQWSSLLSRMAPCHFFPHNL